jgi:beta-1,2-mannosidase
MQKIKVGKFAAILLASALSCLAADPGWTLGPFLRPLSGKPVIASRKTSTFLCPMRKSKVHWEALHTFNPAAVVRNGKIYVLYRAEDNTGDMMIGGHTSRLGLAQSGDGVHFKRRTSPVLYPDNDNQKDQEWPGGCEDPRITESEDGTYVLTYTQWNRKSTDAAIATSKDLITWTKYGNAFASASNGKYADLSWKSAGIVSRISDGRLIAARIKGKYWMYWGEGTVHLATSDDLINWQPVEDASGHAIDVLGSRAGHFDSGFPEVGPPPVLTDRGIVVVYNGKNDAANGSPDLQGGTYAAGQALFAADDPSNLLERLDQPFFKPELPFERSGQYATGTTFVEGLVLYKGKWFLYYGCADSLVGVAISEQ